VEFDLLFFEMIEFFDQLLPLLHHVSFGLLHLHVQALEHVLLTLLDLI
jgi:hypothetical protein